MTQPELLPALDLIVFNEDNPHAVYFQLLDLKQYLNRLSTEHGDPDEDLLNQAMSRLRAFDLSSFEDRTSHSAAIAIPVLNWPVCSMK